MNLQPYLRIGVKKLLKLKKTSDAPAPGSFRERLEHIGSFGIRVVDSKR